MFVAILSLLLLLTKGKRGGSVVSCEELTALVRSPESKGCPGWDEWWWSSSCSRRLTARA